MAIDFKSLVPDIKTVDDIDYYVGYPLIYQYMFERKTSPWEMSTWDDNLYSFEIDTDYVDRLYAVIRTTIED